MSLGTISEVEASVTVKFGVSDSEVLAISEVEASALQMLDRKVRSN